ncbi:MAG: hypothetical protein H6557_33250 [Lewinellaceae bacterium]|nr:hypothetical protein [Lewinellaceae bacterium]
MFDGLGRLTRRSVNGVPKEEFFYDSQGRQHKFVDAMGEETGWIIPTTATGGKNWCGCKRE